MIWLTDFPACGMSRLGVKPNAEIWKVVDNKSFFERYQNSTVTVFCLWSNYRISFVFNWFYKNFFEFLKGQNEFLYYKN